jgi:peroxiredoxin
MVLATGQQAPDVPFCTLDGQPTTLREVVAQGPALFAFYKVTCPVCMLALPFLERLRGRGIQIVPVAQNSPREARQFDSDFRVHTVLADPEADQYPASNAFGITHVPSLFLVQPDGTISWSSVGFMKKDLIDLGHRAGVRMFNDLDVVPEAKSG